MLALLLAATVSTPGLVQADTTFAIRPGDVLVSERLMGALYIEGTDDDQIEVVDADVPVEFERRGSEVLIVPRRRRGDWDDEVSLHLLVPNGMSLRIGSNELELQVEGMRAGLDVALSEGDVELDDIEGQVRVEALQGDLRAERIRGALAFMTLDGRADLDRIEGDVLVETTDGDITLREVVGREIRASTVDGDVVFDGELAAGGQLALVTHDGDVEAWVQGGIGVQVEVSTYDGNFESDFPVRVRSVMAREALRFELGDGAGRMILQSFEGDIRLLRR